MRIAERFEPGDATSYEMFAVRFEPEEGLGFNEPFWIVGCTNFSIATTFAAGSFVAHSYLMERISKNQARVNPWTVRAIALWLNDHPEIDLEVEVRPVR